MYTLIPTKKSVVIKDQDYIFNSFSAFYEVCDLLTVSIFGRYRIAVKTEVIKDIQEFIKVNTAYDHLIISIYTSKAAIDYISAYNPNVNIQDNVSFYEQFKDMISDRNILLEKKAMNILYSSVEHDIIAMETVLDNIVKEFGIDQIITEKMLSTIVILNKIVYPRTVLLAYLRLERYRDVKLKKSIEDLGNDVVLGAMRKNIKALIKEKTVYLRTGQGSWLIKELNTTNLVLMYRALIVECGEISDVQILLNLYEGGKTIYDYLQQS